MTKYKTLLALFAVIFSVQTSHAYNLKQISNKEGLSNNIVLSLYQDYKGFMWFGSSDGLTIYDGRGLEIFKSLEGKETFSEKNIKGMIEAQEGVFWILSDKGLDKVDKIKQSVTPFANIQSNQNLCKDSKNHIFVLQENGSMLAYDEVNNNFAKLNIDEISDAEVCHIMVTSEDKLFVSTKNGQAHVYKINLAEEGNISLSDLGIKKLAEGIISAYSEGDLFYFLDEKYTLFEYDLKNNRKYYIYNLQNQVNQRGQISSIVKQNDNYYVAFRNNGLIALKNYPERPVKYDIESIDIKSGVICLWKDLHQDVIWIASDGQGVFMYSTDTYSLRPTTYNSFALQVNKPATAFFLDKENALWIATAGDGAIKLLDYNFNGNLTNNRKETYSVFNSKLSNNFLSCFAQSKRNIFWIGSQNGLNYYSYGNNQVRRLTMSANIAPLRNVCDVKELNDSTLIIATNGGGLIKANIMWTSGVPWVSKTEQIRAEEKNTPQNFTTLFHDGKEIWAGTEKTGLYKLNISSLSLSKVDLGSDINFESVFAIATDRNENLWLATDRGLIKYQAGKSTIYNENIVSANSVINSILPDSHGNLWLSTNNSIIKFNPSSVSFLNYDFATGGLSITEFGRGACYNAMQQGVFFFGGQNGFVAIEENMNETKEYNPPVIFNKLSIMGQEKNINDYQYGNKLKIDHTQNFFDVSFIAVDYIDGNNYTYFYKLGGNSATWIENGQRSTVSFTDMPSGTYDLQVKYVNKVSGYESPAYKLTVNIIAPWYRSSLAYFAYVMLLFGAAYLAYKILTERNRKSKESELSQIESKHKEELFKAKLSFFSSVAERFANPLTLIYGYSSSIQNEEEAEGNINRNAEMIQYNAEKIDLQISEIVEFGKLENGDKKLLIEKLPISELVENIADSFESICLERNIKYEKNIVENINWNSDRRFLFTIITNLLSDAINNVENNGIIKVNLSESQNKLLLIVSNSGEKTWENTLKLFESSEISTYLENKDETSSDKLKLAISQRLIEILGGRLQIEHDPEQNMLNYIVELNDRESDETTGESIKAEELSEISEIKLSDMVRRNIKNLQKLPTYTINESNQTLLVADKDIDIIHFVSDTFYPDFNVIAANKKEMLEQIISEGKAEIVLVDISIEELDAIEFVTNMKSNQLTSQIPVILTGQKTILDEQEMALTTAGADMCIAKPFNIDELKLSVYRMVSKKNISKSTSNSPRNDTFDPPSEKMIQSDDNKFVQAIMDIINENVSKRDLSVSFIASRMGMSTRHLYRKLNDMEVESPLHMIRDCRLHIAQNLLLNSPLTVDEIIYKSGFYNRGTFFKVFAEKFNCTPREYREKNCEDLSK